MTGLEWFGWGFLMLVLGYITGQQIRWIRNIENVL